jgi:hypothetical protein
VVRSPTLPPLPPSAASVSSFGSRVQPETPEDFERDERIQAMRQTVEEVKGAASVRERLRVCVLVTLLHRVDVCDLALGRHTPYNGGGIGHQRRV